MSDGAELYRNAWNMMQRLGTECAIEICDENEAKAAARRDLMTLAAWRAIKSAIEELDRKPTRKQAN